MRAARLGCPRHWITHRNTPDQRPWIALSYLTLALGLDPECGLLLWCLGRVGKCGLPRGGDVRLVTIGIGDDTDGVHDCPKILDDADVDGGPVYLQGRQVHDAEALAQSMPGPGEVLCVVPREVFLRAARRILGG